MSEPDISRLQHLFVELKEMQLIDTCRKLEPSLHPLAQLQGNKLFKKILYSEKFYNGFLSELDDDTLKFVLLHEEGHIQKGSLLPYCAFFLATVVFTILFYYPYNFGWPYWILYLLIVIPLVYRSVYPLLYKEELKADIFAAEKMREGFHIERPSELLKRLFQKADEKTNKEDKMKKSTFLILAIMIVLGIFPDYHPADCTRIANVNRALEE